MQIELGHVITLLLAGVAFVVWLVRLEGRVNALKAKEASHDSTRDEVIRLQEQVKYLSANVGELVTAIRGRRRAPARED